MASVRNTAGATFMQAVKRIDRLHKEIDRRAKNGKHNEDYILPFKFAKDGARVWSF